MLVIRLRRAGSKKRPFFRVVVTDSRAARDSSFVEVLGHYNARTKPETLEREARGQMFVELTMAPGDMGRVIGRQGRTAQAVRTLANLAAEMDGQKVSV